MIVSLIRPHIRQLVPYSTARDEYAGDATVYLDANESPFRSDVNRYPDPHQSALKVRLGELLSVPPERIFVGNGSDEAIDLIIRVTAAPKDSIATMPPTYGMYKVASHTNDVRVIEAPLNSDFTPDLDAVKDAAAKGAKVLFVCSPNNPTANQLSIETIRSICAVFPGVVVVDEAYLEFARGVSAISLIDECDRVVVLRTLSKAWGLAGARLGMAIANELFVAALSKIKAPYNVSSLTQAHVLKVLSDPNTVRKQVSLILSERERVANALAEIPIVRRVYSSDANFLLVSFDRASELFSYLQSNGVIVRDRTKELYCEGCLRLTVGTQDENDTLLTTIRSFS